MVSPPRGDTKQDGTCHISVTLFNLDPGGSVTVHFKRRVVGPWIPNLVHDYDLSIRLPAVTKVGGATDLRTLLRLVARFNP